jgi:fluoride exporter
VTSLGPREPAPVEPFDPDLDGVSSSSPVSSPVRGARLAAGRGVLLVMAAGGVVGAELRYATGLLLPRAPAFPWATLLVNVLGGLGMGALMAVVARHRHPHPLLRPFLGVGVLGGFTTFSTYSTDTVTLMDAGRTGPALLYAVLSLVAALVATVVGGWAVRVRPGPGDVDRSGW